MRVLEAEIGSRRSNDLGSSCALHLSQHVLEPELGKQRRRQALASLLLLFVNVSYKLTFALKGCLIYLIVQRVKGELTWVIEQC